MTAIVGDFATAGKRVRVETVFDGHWRGGGLETLIQAMADEGFDFLGKIDEYTPTGTIARPLQTYLFAKLQ